MTIKIFNLGSSTFSLSALVNEHNIIKCNIKINKFMLYQCVHLIFIKLIYYFNMFSRIIKFW